MDKEFDFKYEMECLLIEKDEKLKEFRSYYETFLFLYYKYEGVDNFNNKAYNIRSFQELKEKLFFSKDRIKRLEQDIQDIKDAILKHGEY